MSSRRTINVWVDDRQIDDAMVRAWRDEAKQRLLAGDREAWELYSWCQSTLRKMHGGKDPDDWQRITAEKLDALEPVEFREQRQRISTGRIENVHRKPHRITGKPADPMQPAKPPGLFG